MEGARFFYKQAAPPELGWRGHGSSTNRPLLRSSDGGGTVFVTSRRFFGASVGGGQFLLKQVCSSGVRWGGARFFYKQAAPPELGWRGHGSSTNRPLLRSSDGGGTVLLQTGRSSGAR